MKVQVVMLVIALSSTGMVPVSEFGQGTCATTTRDDGGIEPGTTLRERQEGGGAARAG